MAISTCVVSGALKSVDNQALVNSFVRAYLTTPFFHADGTFIGNYQVSTEVASDGTWSLTLIETTTVSKTLTIRIEYPGGTHDRLVKEYTIVVPNTASATLASLIGTQE
jgi:hypothetical protein